jgi:hypothetical protein
LKNQFVTCCPNETKRDFVVFSNAWRGVDYGQINVLFDAFCIFKIVVEIVFRSGEEEENLITEEDLMEGEGEMKEEEIPPEEDLYIKGGYSPRLLQPGDLDIDTVIYEEDEDDKKLVLARKQVVTSGRVKVGHREIS